jgi:short-subunit dehydrogenase
MVIAGQGKNQTAKTAGGQQDRFARCFGLSEHRESEMTKGLAVVTGASSGIGWELARQLAARGYGLLLVARRQDRLEQLAELIEAETRIKADILKLDLTDGAARRRLGSRLSAERERFSLLVNNAGFGAVGPALRVPPDTNMGMIELNIAALTQLSLEAAGILVQKKSGGIINVASTAAFQAVPYMTIYAATKAFVLSFTDALAEELRDSGVRIMALCPGRTRTEFQQVAGERIDEARVRGYMSAAACVRIGLNDFEAGKRISVTGTLNRLQTFAGRHFPRSIVVPMAARLEKRRVR